MKTNEEIVYQIIKKKVLIIIAVPLLFVGVYFGYTKIGGVTEYSVSTSLLINNRGDNSESYSTERYVTMTNSIGELITSSIVLDKTSDALSIDNLSAQDIRSMVNVSVRPTSQAIVINVTSANQSIVIPVANTLVQSVKSVSLDIFGIDAVHIIDVPTSESEVSASLSKTKLVGVYVIGFIMTLLSILGLSWEKEKNRLT